MEKDRGFSLDVQKIYFLFCTLYLLGAVADCRLHQICYNEMEVLIFTFRSSASDFHFLNFEPTMNSNSMNLLPAVVLDFV
jgi:hypothetical protein